MREGQFVKQGSVLANLEDWDYRADLAAAEGKYEEAMATMNRALAQNDGHWRGTNEAKVDYLRSEVARARERLDRASIKTPIDGM